ncbi:hypothetical protein FOZ62_022420, partial [Perkinsus olseni]
HQKRVPSSAHNRRSEPRRSKKAKLRIKTKAMPCWALRVMCRRLGGAYHRVRVVARTWTSQKGVTRWRRRGRGLSCRRRR